MKQNIPLVAKAKKGDNGAFASLVDIYQRPLYNIALSITGHEQDAMDAVSDALLVCWEKLPTLSRDRYFKTWLTRILINKCKNILREGRRFTAEDHREEAAHENHDQRIDIERSMQRLTYPDRLVLTMFYFDDYSVKQIAEILDISTGAVKTRLSRSRAHFREIHAGSDETVGDKNGKVGTSYE